MYYAPHILERKVVKEYEYDKDGNPIQGTDGDSWERVCKCKCYDQSADRTYTVNGVTYPYKYRVVTEKVKINAGDVVRVLNADGSLRGEGIVINPMTTDYLNYGQIWLE